jgi:hypothetical protein
VAAWGLGLLAVIGGAIAGGHVGSDGTEAHATSAVAGAHATSLEAASATGTGRFGDDIPAAVILLEFPRGAHPVITSRDVLVSGRVRDGTGPVVVMLESRAPERLITVTVNPKHLPDHRDSSHSSAFIATLPLPDPRPTGPAVVHVISFDPGGTATDILLRTIQIGPFLDPTYGDGAARPPTGEDGLMGGITSGTNFAWKADDR